MSGQPARDIRYGRRGGRWVDHAPGQLLDELRQLRQDQDAGGVPAGPVDRARLFHPHAIAVARAHERRWPGSCASDDTVTTPRPPCDCQPDPEDLAQVWAGRARMAAARRAAGVALDDVDLEALQRRERGEL